MSQKASLHMNYAKGMDAAQGAENERRGWDKERYERKFDWNGNECHYDWFRRKLNFEIVKGKIMPMTSQEIPVHERLQNRLEELGFKNYKNGARNAPNVLMDFVIGGNRQRLRDMAFKNQQVNFDKPDERNANVQRDQEIVNWALDTYRFLSNRYGEENIIAFNVHLDETTPHAHVQIVPVAEKNKRGRVKAGQERGTKKVVSFSGVIGEGKDALRKYLDQMHTDYHLQVGYKYGLERGTFFDDLTPEEQAERMHMNKKQYVEYVMLKKANEQLTNDNEELKSKLAALTEEVKQLEKKVKSFTTMLTNLSNRKEQLEIEISALEEIRDTGNEEIEKQLEEKQKQLNGINEKIAIRTGQLDDVTKELGLTRKELEELGEVKNQTKQSIKNMAADAIKRHDRTNEQLKEATRAIQEKRKELTKMDKTGELEKARRQVEDRDAVLYRRWPEARNAVKSIFDFASSPSAHDFTPQQALHVEHAIITSGTTRTKAAEELMSLAKKNFDNNKTYSGWIDGAAREVMKIATNTHQRLNALLKVQPKNQDGSPSYITDLTDWAGNQLQR